MPTDAELVREANRVNYRLRSTFFLRKLREYDTLSFPAQVNALLPVAAAYNWDNHSEWGIGEDAFAYIAASEIEPIQAFCHPKLLREHPHLLAYYRNVAALPQKAVGLLIGKSVATLEATPERARPLTETEARRLATLFNEHVTLIIDSSVRTLTLSELNGLLLVSTGSQIDGSWRNAIGEEAERVVRQLLLSEAPGRTVLFALHSAYRRCGAAIRPGTGTRTDSGRSGLSRFPTHEPDKHHVQQRTRHQPYWHRR